MSKTDSGASEKSFENVNRRTDEGQKVITIAHPEHSSGELKKQKTKTLQTDFTHFFMILCLHIASG